jgi:hypothetical protein
VFSAVALLAVGLIAVARRLPSHHLDSEQGLGDIGAALRSPAVAAGMWLAALLSDAAETRGLDQGYAAALMNLAWAGDRSSARSSAAPSQRPPAIGCR